ncbi:MAG: glycerophosphodiester phosphodiesterase [Sphaerochaetaceae bacterium]|nr:glycerophosphodiester phosphodiesterase [Sphaerochaetaceae bacterium]
MSISYNTNNKPLLYCHRGVHINAPENSLPAFKDVMELGFKAIETDIHICKSGEIVIIHDNNTNRMTGVNLEIERSTLSQLKELDLGINCSPEYKNTKIPTLRELFELCGNNVLYDLELKSSTIHNRELAIKTWKLIQEFHLEFNCIVSSFNPVAIKAFERCSNYALQTAVIFSEGQKVPKILQHGWGSHLCGSTILKPDYVQVNDDFIKKIEDTGLKVLPWCVDTIADAKTILQYDCMGVITNRPTILSKSELFY